MRLPALLCVLSALACTDHALGSAPVASGQECQILASINHVRRVDILFVIDSSPAMAPWRDRVQTAIAQMTAPLRDFKHMVDLRLGVVSGDLGAPGAGLSAACAGDGDGARLRVDPACTAPDAADGRPADFLQPGAQWLEMDWRGQTNFTGDLARVVGCLVNHVGSAGCEIQQPLEAANRALYRPGFLRDPDADLRVVFVSAQDDCSLASYVSQWPGVPAPLACASLGHQCGGVPVPADRAFSADLRTCGPRDDGPLVPIAKLGQVMDGLKPRPREQIGVMALLGWPDQIDDDIVGSYGVTLTPGPVLQPVCTRGDAAAYPSPRLHQFHHAFNGAPTISLCDPQFEYQMQGLVDWELHFSEPVCFWGEALADADPVQPGVQAECKVSLLIPSASGYTEQTLPPCEADNQTGCWHMEHDVPGCGGWMPSPRWEQLPDGWPILPEPGSMLNARCLCEAQ